MARPKDMVGPGSGVRVKSGFEDTTPPLPDQMCVWLASLQERTAELAQAQAALELQQRELQHDRSSLMERSFPPTERGRRLAQHSNTTLNTTRYPQINPT